jgi:hypothetical protein
LRAAITSADPGTLIATSSGTHALGSIELDRAIELIGCEGTVIAGDLEVIAPSARLTELELAGSIRVAGAGELDAERVLISGSGIRIEGGGEARFHSSVVRAPEGIEVSSGAALHLENTVVEEANVAGISAIGAGTSLTIDHSVSSRSLHGVVATEGATVSITRSVFEQNRSSGLLADGATITADQIYVTTNQEAGVFGANGARLRITRAYFERNGGNTISSAGIGSRVLVEHAIIQRPLTGHAFDVRGASFLEVKRAIVSNSSGVAVSVYRAGAWMDASDLIIDGVTSNGSETVAIDVTDGAHLRLERALIRDSDEHGIHVAKSAAIAELRVVRIEESGGTALLVERGARLEAKIVAVNGAVSSGLIARDPDTSASLEEISIEGSGARGVSFEVNGGAKVELERARVLGGDKAGVVVSGEQTRLMARDLEISETLGRGLSVEGGAEVELERALFRENNGIAVLARDRETEVSLRELLFQGTGGAAALSTHLARLSITRYVVDTAMVGFGSLFDGALLLGIGRIEKSGVAFVEGANGAGACLIDVSMIFGAPDLGDPEPIASQ